MGREVTREIGLWRLLPIDGTPASRGPGHIDTEIEIPPRPDVGFAASLPLPEIPPPPPVGLGLAWRMGEDAPTGGGWSPGRKLGLAGAGALFAVGSGFAIRNAMRAHTDHQAARAACVENLRCDVDELVLAQQVRDRSELGTLGFAVTGATALGAGALWLTAPRGPGETAVRPAVTDGQLGVVLSGVFE